MSNEDLQNTFEKKKSMVTQIEVDKKINTEEVFDDNTEFSGMSI